MTINPQKIQAIEILPVALLDEHRELVNELRELSGSLGSDFGWHYLLDLVWIIEKLGDIKEKKIMDAGAGTGVMQWYLADHGADVLSVDRASREDLSLRFRARFRVRGLRKEDLQPNQQVLVKNIRQRTRLRTQVREFLGIAELRRSPGRVVIYNQDLKELAHIENNSIDAIVAVSALEHNQPADLEIVVSELLRVLKPGGLLLATLGASRDHDWYHEASSGWCYSEASLKRIFDLPDELASNYDRYDELFAELKECAELRDNLAQFYYQSGDNGMPWGVWDPKYQSVGVCKIKQA